MPTYISMKGLDVVESLLAVGARVKSQKLFSNNFIFVATHFQESPPYNDLLKSFQYIFVTL